MFAGKPVIGIVGGIGSGKSFVARIFGELGCRVIDSDQAVSRIYERDDVRQTLRQWWGDEVLDPAGVVNRSAVARRIFAEPRERERLERLVHPLVGQLRDEEMAESANDSAIVAYVWDTPLLIEAGLAGQCDELVYVDSPPEERLRRVVSSRGWTPAEWTQRENSQLPLDKKRRMANYSVRNTAGAGEVRSQVRDILSRILAGTPDSGTPEAAR